MALVARKPNKLKSYHKTSQATIELQEHQVKFIKQFIYSNLHGAIVRHGFKVRVNK